MKRLLKCLLVLFSGCLGLGFIVSKVEKKKGWVEGHKPYGIYEKHIKRPLDFAFALFTLILFWPILLFIAIAVRINMGSPIVFEQERPGLGGEIFRIKKFRTMTDERNAEGNYLPDEQRITRFGHWLRASSGDEIPELFNILKGDMSLIGPRPLMKKYLPFYSERERLRHSVRPGLTGYAQTNGRNEISWEKKFEYDVWYVEHLSFVNDLKILFNTVKVVIAHDGIELNAIEDFDEYRKHMDVTSS